MKSGRLRHRVRIESPTNGLDSLGAPTKIWTGGLEVQADITSVSGKEYFRAGRDLGDEIYKIIIREIPNVHVDATFRAVDVDTNAVYSISAVLEDHTRSTLTLIARAGSGYP